MRRSAPVRALTLTVDENIAPLSAHLYAARIRHRIYEDRGAQVVEVLTEADAERVRDLYSRWRSGAAMLRAEPAPVGNIDWRAVLRYPAVLAVAIVAVVCLPVTWPLDHDQLGTVLPWMTIVELSVERGGIVGHSLAEALMAGQIWRLVTPVFLHFGFVHLAFNVALFVEFGRRIEHALGGWPLLFLAATIGAVSNVAQYVIGGSLLFGGLSGVVYGLFGFVVVRARAEPLRPEWRLHPGFVLTFVALLVLMSTGVTELIGLGIANGAHWSGLAMGALLAFVTARSRRGDV